MEPSDGSGVLGCILCPAEQVSRCVVLLYTRQGALNGLTSWHFYMLSLLTLLFERCAGWEASTRVAKHAWRRAPATPSLVYQRPGCQFGGYTESIARKVCWRNEPLEALCWMCSGLFVKRCVLHEYLPMLVTTITSVPSLLALVIWERFHTYCLLNLW